MEKKTPTYDLSLIKNVFSDTACLVMSSKALRNLTSHGINLEELVTAIQKLTPEDFIHATTLSSDEDEVVWQDVYSSSLLKQFTLKFQETKAGRFIIC